MQRTSIEQFISYNLIYLIDLIYHNNLYFFYKLIQVKKKEFKKEKIEPILLNKLPRGEREGTIVYSFIQQTFTSCLLHFRLYIGCTYD